MLVPVLGGALWVSGCSASGAPSDECENGSCGGVGASAGTAGGGGTGGASGASGSAGTASGGQAGSGGDGASGGDAGSGGGGGLAGAAGSAGSAGTAGTGGVGGSSGSAGSAGTAGTGGSAGGPIDFGDGWQIPDPGNPSPVDGGGATDIVVGPGADASTPGRFGAADTGEGPSVVYPLDHTMSPPNMNMLDVHWRPAAGQTHFELSFIAPTRTLKIYVGCTPLGGGCSYATANTEFWSKLVPSARGTAPVRWRIRGVTAGGVVGGSAERQLSFSRQDILGGIYYWNTSGVGQVQRQDFGIPSPPIENYLNVTQAGGGTCLGCHVMSRSGDAIVVGLNIPSPATYRTFDVVSRIERNPWVRGGANFFSFSPDSKYLLYSDTVTIGLRNVETGAQMKANVVPYGTMPDWSPSGRKMVYAKPKNRPLFAAPGIDSASLELSNFDGVSFQAPTTLVPAAGGNNYYPAFSPDNEWIIYNRSPSNNSSYVSGKPEDGGGLPDSELWIVSANGGTPVRLGRISAPGWLQWAKWAPAKHDSFAGKVMWVTFTSARAYGLRFTDGQLAQLWMVAIDVDKLRAGQESSFNAFWLPTQSSNGGNHIGQWTTRVPRKPCNRAQDCEGGETCTNRICMPRPR